MCWLPGASARRAAPRVSRASTRRSANTGSAAARARPAGKHSVLEHQVPDDRMLQLLAALAVVATSWSFHASQNSLLDFRSAWISWSNCGSPMFWPRVRTELRDHQPRALLPVAEARRRAGSMNVCQTWLRRWRGSLPSRPDDRLGGGVPGEVVPAPPEQVGGVSPRWAIERPTHRSETSRTVGAWWRLLAASEQRSGGCARRASSAARRQIASSTSSEARTSRPCSSHVYQVVPTPASARPLRGEARGAAAPAVGKAHVARGERGAALRKSESSARRVPLRSPCAISAACARLIQQWGLLLLPG